MEGDTMAMSLLFALLGVVDRDDLNNQPGKYSIDDPDIQRANKYDKDLTSKQQREVRKALYDALYAIVEGGEVNRDLNMAIGKALCQAITGNHQEDLQREPGIRRLREVLNPIVRAAIDEA
jgi:hypothetical protein